MQERFLSAFIDHIFKKKTSTRINISHNAFMIGNKIFFERRLSLYLEDAGKQRNPSRLRIISRSFLHFSKEKNYLPKVVLTKSRKISINGMNKVFFFSSFPAS